MKIRKGKVRNILLMDKEMNIDKKLSIVQKRLR
jgi:hypothetical protein